jgi:hypothetical protein
VDVGIIDCVSEKVSECVEDVCPNFPNPEPEASRDLTAVNRDSPCRDHCPNSCRERYWYKKQCLKCAYNDEARKEKNPGDPCTRDRKSGITSRIGGIQACKCLSPGDDTVDADRYETCPEQ